MLTEAESLASEINAADDQYNLYTEDCLEEFYGSDLELLRRNTG